MNTTVEVTTAAQVLALTEGSVVQVTAGGRVRTVRVVELMETESCHYAFTSSGRVRPGHRAGGCFTVWKRDQSVTFQPTMQQQSHYVTALTVQGLAH
jgi:hypothetical protein